MSNTEKYTLRNDFELILELSVKEMEKFVKEIDDRVSAVIDKDFKSETLNVGHYFVDYERLSIKSSLKELGEERAQNLFDENLYTEEHTRSKVSKYHAPLSSYTKRV